MTHASPFSEEEIHNILIWMPGGIADSLLALPALDSLRSKYPHSRITVAAHQPVTELLHKNPAIDTVVEIPAKNNTGRLGRARFASGLKKYRFDLGVPFADSYSSALMVWLAGARIRMGHNTGGREALLTHPVAVLPATRQLHRADYFHDALKPLELPPPKREWPAWVGRKGAPQANEFIFQRQVGKKDVLIAVQPGAARPEKSWHAERFGILCQKLVGEHGVKILLLGGQEEKSLLAQVEKFCPPQTAFIAAGLGLIDVAALLKRSRLFVGNDSGLLHLAASVGTPVVGIFGPGSPLHRGPYAAAEAVEEVTKNYACSPCGQKFFKECKASPHGRPYCLEDISVSDVARAVERLLANTGRKKRGAKNGT